MALWFLDAYFWHGSARIWVPSHAVRLVSAEIETRAFAVESEIY